MQATQPHIVAIQETCLHKDSKIQNFPNYDIIRVDRPNTIKASGGIALLVMKHITYNVKKLTPYSNGKLEIQAITIKQRDKHIDIINIYDSHGNHKKDELNHYFNQINKNHIIVWDFHGHYPIWEPTKNPIPNTCGRTTAKFLDIMRILA